MKDVETVAHAIGMYGPNMAGVEGEDWKRHRKANQRAFNEVGAPGDVVVQKSQLILSRIEKYPAGMGRD